MVGSPYWLVKFIKRKGIHIRRVFPYFEYAVGNVECLEANVLLPLHKDNLGGASFRRLQCLLC